MVGPAFDDPEADAETLQWLSTWDPGTLAATLQAGVDEADADVAAAFGDDADVRIEFARGADGTTGRIDDERPDPETLGDVDAERLYGAIDRFEVSNGDVTVGFRQFEGADATRDDPAGEFRDGDKRDPPAAVPVDHLYVRGVAGNADLVRALYRASTGSELDGEVDDRLDEVERESEEEPEPADLNELLGERANFEGDDIGGHGSSGPSV